MELVFWCLAGGILAGILAAELWREVQERRRRQFEELRQALLAASWQPWRDEPTTDWDAELRVLGRE